MVRGSRRPQMVHTAGRGLRPDRGDGKPGPALSESGRKRPCRITGGACGVGCRIARQERKEERRQEQQEKRCQELSRRGAEDVKAFIVIAWLLLGFGLGVVLIGEMGSALFGISNT